MGEAAMVKGEGEGIRGQERPRRKRSARLPEATREE